MRCVDSMVAGVSKRVVVCHSVGDDGLERVFSKGHRFYDRIFYDRREGAYYDRSVDLFLSLEEVKAFGVV